LNLTELKPEVNHCKTIDTIDVCKNGPYKTQRRTTVPIYVEICQITTWNSVITTV